MNNEMTYGRDKRVSSSSSRKKSKNKYNNNSSEPNLVITESNCITLINPCQVLLCTPGKLKPNKASAVDLRSLRFDSSNFYE